MKRWRVQYKLPNGDIATDWVEHDDKFAAIAIARRSLNADKRWRFLSVELAPILDPDTRLPREPD